MLRVKVKISNIAVGPDPTNVTTYKKGQIFECTEELAQKLGKDVEVLGTVETAAKETATPAKATATATPTAKK